MVKDAEKQRVLAKNAKRINEHHRIAVELNARSEKAGKEAIKAVIVAGKNLMACKAMLEHGDWLPWLGNNCKGISERTAQNYIGLVKYASNTKRVADLLECTSLRQAYSLVAGSKPPKQPNNGDGSDLDPIPRKVKSLLKTLEDECAGTYDESILEAVKPIVDWYNEATALKA